ncbi:unnamed protein product [[Candida] boidinii]|nr:hypothetical protein BVG19_g1087 [[Candida] boidinii]OWB50105.1 hypothetical protein B5S27_g1652 [[Candida] boidinii]GME91119.1 unnamed protein product [[Candida] boidinii]
MSLEESRNDKKPLSSQKRKPARLQVDPDTIDADSKPPQTGEVFNIWYNKWTGGERNGKSMLTHALHRCDVKRDSGYTKADKNCPPNSLNNTNFICLYFARGTCCNGKSCEYLHRLPSNIDIFSSTVDCFGREKFSGYRDDMAGIGSFSKVNRTLYVGRIDSMENNVEARVNKAFGEFGDIERVRIIKDKRVAFVTYRLESQAQFAKESMYGQSLDKNDQEEALNIRWANEDPDPKARRREQEILEKNALETAALLLETLKRKNEQQNNEEETEIKRHKIIVEEPVENSESEATPGNNSTPKMIESSSIISDTSSLYLLRQLKERKKALAESKVEKPEVGVLLGGYSSSDEEDD